MIERIAWGGWPNCVRLANDNLEVILTADVGPRAIRFGRPGGPNMFREFTSQLGKTGGERWMNFGGHRLWHAPELHERTYHPDNDPVAVSELDGTVRLTQRVEATTGIEKEMEFSIHPDKSCVEVLHRLTNRGAWEIELAAWAITLLAPGGRALLPQHEPRTHTHLQPVRPLVFWGYTDMSDPRWTWGKRLIELRQDPAVKSAQKIGFMSEQGWLAYELPSAGQVFIKRHALTAGMPMADFGCNAEVFTNDAGLELESLSPLIKVPPGGCIEHRESWWLLDATLPTKEAELLEELDLLISKTVPL